MSRISDSLLSALVRPGALLLAAGLGLWAAPVAAQATADTAAVVPVAPGTDGVSPGGAFLRSLVLPAWGHAAIGSERGAFYTAVEGGSAWMLVRLRSRLRSARDIVAVREAEARAAARAEGITDPAEIEAAVDEVEGVQSARSRLEAREQQREDWVALAIFSVLLSGVDAYVSAHLQDFPGMPDPMETALTPSPLGGVQFGVRLAFPLRR